MPAASTSLEELRRRVDELDDALLDALIRRAEVVGEIARLKREDATPPMRPGREAQILRRLLARHRGAFPRTLLVRIWREILSGMTAIQSEMHVAVCMPTNAAGFWDLARDQYGAHSPMTGYRSSGEVVGAVAEGRASLGVLPLPGQGQSEAWWRLLTPGDTPKPRIIARLPFGARGNARAEGGGEALVIARIEPEPSGKDRSLYLIETAKNVSRTRVTGALANGGLPATALASATLAGDSIAQLVEFEGWLLPDDTRLKLALAPIGAEVLRVASLGGYAVPLGAAELADVGAA
jgi:chorismate mutase / prephenate dehydratase